MLPSRVPWGEHFFLPSSLGQAFLFLKALVFHRRFCFLVCPTPPQALRTYELPASASLFLHGAADPALGLRKQVFRHKPEK